jgi:hypothetical protein
MRKLCNDEKQMIVGLVCIAFGVLFFLKSMLIVGDVDVCRKYATFATSYTEEERVVIVRNIRPYFWVNVINPARWTSRSYTRKNMELYRTIREIYMIDKYRTFDSKKIKEEYHKSRNIKEEY